jgi:hypothetical protein
VGTAISPSVRLAFTVPAPRQRRNPSEQLPSASREGYYDHNQEYCVFDAADIAKLHKMLDNLPTEG